VASIHSAQGSTKHTPTQRTLAAIENKYVCAIGHPTGRLINRRAAMDLDAQIANQTAGLSAQDIYLRALAAGAGDELPGGLPEYQPDVVGSNYSGYQPPPPPPYNWQPKDPSVLPPPYSF